jgi:hypothetical protein
MFCIAEKCEHGVAIGNAFEAHLSCFLVGQYINLFYLQEKAGGAGGGRRLVTASAVLVSSRLSLVQQLPELGNLLGTHAQ